MPTFRITLLFNEADNCNQNGDKQVKKTAYTYLDEETQAISEKQVLHWQEPLE